jgi:hypothetical protein
VSVLTAVVSTAQESTQTAVESVEVEAASVVPELQLVAITIMAIAIAKIAFFIDICFFVELLYHLVYQSFPLFLFNSRICLRTQR